MDRHAKRELISQLNAVFLDTGVVVVAHNIGMVAAQSAEFRRVVKEAGGAVKVAKNKLVQLAIKGTPTADISDLMKGPTILAYSKDPIAAAKAAVTYSKSNEKLVILGGAMGAVRLDANAVRALAELPSLDEIRAKLIGLLTAPAAKIARTIKEPSSKLARVIHAKSAKGNSS